MANDKNVPHVRIDQKELMFKNVRESARIQRSAENRENYFQSCEKHGGELALVVAEVRKEYAN